MAVAQWAAKYGTRIAGALLVAPSDVEAETYTFDTNGFAPIPLEPLPFRSIVAASTNDKYVSFERARFFAARGAASSLMSAKKDISIPVRDLASGIRVWNSYRG